MPNFSLTKEEVSFFRDAGYLKLRWTVDPEDCADATSYLDSVPLSEIKTRGSVKKLYRLINRHPIFNSIATSKAVIDPLRSVIGPNIVLTTNRHNQAVMSDSVTSSAAYHRDVQHWTRSSISVGASKANGPLRIIPTSERFGYPEPSRNPAHGGTWLSDDQDYSALAQQALSLEIEPGGIVLLNNLTYHSTGHGDGTAKRYAITFCYHAYDELSPSLEDHQILVSGDRIYKGNDQNL